MMINGIPDVPQVIITFETMLITKIFGVLLGLLIGFCYPAAMLAMF